MAEALTIARLGARGDGIADTPGGPVYVPFALPGETVRVEREGERGRLVAIEAPAPGRRAPLCPLFTRCGGCAAQHMAPATYRDWKHGLVTAALDRARIATTVAPLVDAHGTGRRRAVFHLRNVDGAMAAGFMAARSHDLVAVAHCPVLVSGLDRAAAAAEALARLLKGANKPLDMQVTATLAGLDIDIRGYGLPGVRLQGLGLPGDRARLMLVEAAARLDLARLSVNGDVLVERRPPAIAQGRALVVPPPGGFLQATQAGEAALAALVNAACGKARHVADLFAGIGPFALALAEKASVHAVDGDAAALAALGRAARLAQGLRRITTETRDLFRRPLLPTELARYDAVVFDPPRAGAEAQARQIVASQLGLAVAVSCDPGSFARDARILVDGGFRLAVVTPVDQFRYAAHVEMVGVFERDVPRRRQR